MNREYSKIHAMVSALPVFSDHEHHQDAEFFNGQPMSLDRVMNASYAAWMGHPIDGRRETRAALVDHLRHNTSYIWLERGIQAVHRVREPISAGNWDRISGKICRAYKADRDFHWKVLKVHGYERIVQDCYWDPGTDAGCPEIFAPSFRIDKFMYGFHPESVAPNEFRTWERYGFKGGSLDDYVEHMRELLRRRRRQGALVALKCAEAYNRDIDFLPDDRAAARKAFGVHPARIKPAQARAFGNYIFNRACEAAAELEVPFQVHTGLARLAGSNPMLFEPILLKYPQVRFVMFHSGYPWIDTSAGLAFTHNNVLPSLTWTATISTTASIRALNEFLDAGRSANNITWGSDTWTPEESVGAMLAWRTIVAAVIADRLALGLLRNADADNLAEKLMFANGRRVYMR